MVFLAQGWTVRVAVRPQVAYDSVTVPPSSSTAADADIDTLAPTLIGATHLVFSERKDGRPDPVAVRRTVVTILASALR
ncbi:hypothetical protein [Plantactinospora sonchi]|uniref:Uncharacterized protein n=1 Tax=Plantactinospora sonchi TaxID=1544735 RepID=A0ABU7S1Z9_9ACTN